MPFVVDTNVAVAANGQGTHADELCQLACITRLRNLTKDGVVVVDDGSLIIDEYRKRLNLSGRPGVGDLFLKHVFDHQYSGERVMRVPVTQSEDDSRGFEELPVNTLDRADRKFLAAAVVGDAVVVNATDSDWNEERALLDELEVDVVQLCPKYASKVAEPG